MNLRVWSIIKEDLKCVTEFSKISIQTSKGKVDFYPFSLQFSMAIVKDLLNKWKLSSLTFFVNGPLHYSIKLRIHSDNSTFEWAVIGKSIYVHENIFL